MATASTDKSKEVPFAKIPKGGRFKFQGREYVKVEEGNRYGNRCECPDDRDLHQEFFDTVPVLPAA